MAIARDMQYKYQRYGGYDIPHVSYEAEEINIQTYINKMLCNYCVGDKKEMYVCVVDNRCVDD